MLVSNFSEASVQVTNHFSPATSKGFVPQLLLSCGSCMSDLPFTLDQLRILKAIAEGSFKRADSLYVSQPAVSLQVQNLERQLDVPLFDRGGRRAQLTAGYLLLSYGEKFSPSVRKPAALLKICKIFRAAPSLLALLKRQGHIFCPA